LLPATVSAEVAETTRCRSELQRALALLLSTLALNSMAADVLAAPGNLPQLADILGAPTTVIAALTDLSVGRSLLQLLTHLVRAWLPVAGVATGCGASSAFLATSFAHPAGALGAPAAAASAAAAAAGAGAGGGAASPQPPALPALEAYALTPLPSPLPQDAAAAFFSACLHVLPRTPFALALPPTFSTADGTASMAVNDGVSLLLALAVHAAAHSQSPAVSPAPVSPIDVVAHIVTGVLPELGVSAEAARAVGHAAVLDLQRPPAEATRQPTALRGPFLAALDEIRGAAVAAAVAAEQTASAAVAAGAPGGTGAAAVDGLGLGLGLGLL